MFKENELLILSSFFPLVNRAYSTKEIELRSGYSHERAHTTLNLLEKDSLLKKRNYGNVNLYRLNLEKRELFLVFVFYMNSIKKKLKIGHSLDIDFDERLHSVIHLPKKDAFLYILKDNISKSEITGTKNSCLMHESEFVSRLQQESSFFEDMASSIVINGYERFYELVFRKGSRHHGE